MEFSLYQRRVQKELGTLSYRHLGIIGEVNIITDRNGKFNGMAEDVYLISGNVFPYLGSEERDLLLKTCHVPVQHNWRSIHQHAIPPKREAARNHSASPFSG